MGEVLRAFLWLGCTSFGGPVAHLAYFRREFVERRRWLPEHDYAELVALCQFLPGPASSKVGFSLGLMRAGYRGGLAAWAGFTLPSAALMVLAAYGVAAIADSPTGRGLVHGLKLAAVAIVAQAVWVMARSLCPDLARRGIAVAAAVLVVLAPIAIGQPVAILMGVVLGLAWCRDAGSATGGVRGSSVSRRVGAAAAVAFAGLLALSLTVRGDSVLAMFAAFYRSGALVFGGGHVVLPLLDAAVVAPGWTDHAAFLAGYGAAQAVPGPLFTFAAYLGTVMTTPLGGVPGASVAIAGIFLPGLLLQLAALPFWGAVRSHAAVRAAMRGANAGVVGVLAAALYRPVWTSAITGPADVGVVAVALALLIAIRAPPIIVVTLSALAGVCESLVT